jgi:hypothetical protein
VKEELKDEWPFVEVRGEVKEDSVILFHELNPFGDHSFGKEAILV